LALKSSTTFFRMYTIDGIFTEEVQTYFEKNKELR